MNYVMFEDCTALPRHNSLHYAFLYIWTYSYPPAFVSYILTFYGALLVAIFELENLFCSTFFALIIYQGVKYV